MGYTNFVNGNKPNLSAPNLNNMQIELMKLVFPIGSTYITQEETNPSTILNFGTWERVKGKVLVGLDEDDTDFNTIGKTGGKKTHTLTVDEMPSHNHDLYIEDFLGQSGSTTTPAYFIAINNNATSYNYATGVDSTTEIAGTKIKGGSQPYNILQPYQVVGYMWIRTA